MNKKTMKVISIITIILSVIMLVTVSFAADVSPDQITGKNTGLDMSKLQTSGNKIAGVIRNFGIVASVIILMILGIKYMMGSAEEKAEYKKTMIPYVVGVVILFAATTIASAIVQFGNNL